MNGLLEVSWAFWMHICASLCRADRALPVNRCQREIQKSIKEPAQGAQLQSLHNDMLAKMELVCSRLESIDEVRPDKYFPNLPPANLSTS